MIPKVGEQNVDHPLLWFPFYVDGIQSSKEGSRRKRSYTEKIRANEVINRLLKSVYK